MTQIFICVHLRKSAAKIPYATQTALKADHPGRNLWPCSATLLLLPARALSAAAFPDQYPRLSRAGGNSLSRQVTAVSRRCNARERFPVSACDTRRDQRFKRNRKTLVRFACSIVGR